MMKKYILTVFLAVNAFLGPVFAQVQNGPDLKFQENVHDFGSIKEDGKVTCFFEFENTGDMPLEIRKVTASCGCTTPAFIKEPIAPGAKSKIEVAYNTEGRPGNFSKTITVYSNSVLHPTYTLNIRGTVVAKKNSLDGLYPKAFGNLRLTRTTCSFGQINIGSIKTLTIPVYNDNEELPISIAFAQVPKHLKVVISNALVKPGETSIITINYVTKDAKDYGHREDVFYLLLDEDKTMHPITVTADLREDFSTLKASDKIPVATYSSNMIDFGTIKQGDVISAFIELSNSGEAPLLIRKCVNNVPALSAKIDKKEIAVGKTAKIKIELNTKSLHSKLRYYVEVITNDPVMPIKRLFVVGNVVDAE